MANKKWWLGMLVMVLVFGICVVGCLSTMSNFYDLGNVSEDNCALIQVSPVSNDSDYRIIDLVKIDGQGNINQWQKPNSMGAGITTIPKAVVRVTPGEHTFTITFIRSLTNALSGQTNNREIPVSLTYNCIAGKGYDFKFSAKISESPFTPTTAEIVMFEYDIDKDGNFGGLRSISSMREVAKKTEIIPVTTGDL
jgi:hypothetical protein